MYNYEPEKDLKCSAKPLGLYSFEKIRHQMQKSVCKIICPTGGHGTGFFCEIFYNDWDSLRVMMTNNHVLNEEAILPGSNIILYLNNDRKKIEILIDESRITYTNSKYDITIIEIKNNDGFKKDEFLDIDEQIYNDNPDETFRNQPIYLLHYSKGIEIMQSQGTIKRININNYDLEHLCNSEKGSSGGPLINSQNYKVIGIHKGSASNKFNWNLGTFLKLPIEMFNEEITSIKKNVKENQNKMIEKDISDTFMIIGDEEINNSEINNNEIKMTFNVNQNNKVKIFDKNFVEKNDKLCKIIINNKEYELCSEFNIGDIKLNKKNQLEIRLIGINNINDISWMFYDCKLLSSLEINLDTSNITNMCYIFCGCTSLESLSGIDFWNTSKVWNMNHLFYNCKSLKSLPNLSDWNTSNVVDMRYMFSNCELLKSLPDISRWNISNVTIINNMFSKCKSLESLPDISKWDTTKIIDMYHIFYKCESLKYLPDISNWNTFSLGNINDILSGCKSILSIPNIKTNSEMSSMNYSRYEYDYLFKYLIIGNEGVGKSSLLIRFVDDTFSYDYVTTIGIDFKIKSLEIDGELIKIQIWDTAGQERFRNIISSYYRGAQGIFLVYDITNKESFYSLKNWMSEIEKHCNINKIKIIIVGNKRDLESRREVTFEEGKQFASKFKFKFYETSAKESYNVHDTFIYIAKEIIRSGNENKKEKNESKKNNNLLIHSKKNKNTIFGYC